jgi:hypothetical protein
MNIYIYFQKILFYFVNVEFFFSLFKKFDRFQKLVTI